MIIQKKCLIGLVFVVMLGMSFFYEGRYVRAVASNDGEMTSCLPQIRIKTNDNIGNSLTKDRGYVNAGFEVIQTPESTIETTGEIKVRGNTTSLAKKKPYTIKFSSKTDLFGMGTAKKWVLLANAYDPSLLRNYIAFDLAQKLDLSYTTKQRYVDVWMDGEELGSYLLVEPVEVGKTRVDLDLEQGDFMVEYEAGRVEYGATYIVTPEKKIRFVCSEPETPTEVELQHMTDIWNQAEQAICSGDYQRVCAIIDINSFVNLYLLNEYMKTVDFGFSSVFIYYKNGKLYAGPAWDYDLSSGNASNIAYPTYNTGENGNYEDLWAIDNLLWKLILSYPQVDEVCKLRFAEVAKTFQSVYMPNGVIVKSVHRIWFPF